MIRKLNLDIVGSVSDLESELKSFLLKKISYKTLFKGKGLEFDGYRNFTPEDDAADIDWRASLKANELLTKQYIEERDMNIIFAIDVSDNMVFGSSSKLKCEYAAETSAALSHLMLDSKERVGFVLFSNEIKKFSLPSSGNNSFDFFVDELANPLNYGGICNFEKALNFILDFHPADVLVIVSDFIKLTKDSYKNLNFISKKLETMALIIKDPLDRTMPDISGEVVIEGSSGEQLVIDPKIAKKIYEKNALEQENMVKKMFEETGIDCLELNTEKSFVYSLAEFLKERIEEQRNFI